MAICSCADSCPSRGDPGPLKLDQSLLSMFADLFDERPFSPPHLITRLAIPRNATRNAKTTSTSKALPVIGSPGADLHRSIPSVAGWWRPPTSTAGVISTSMWRIYFLGGTAGTSGPLRGESGCLRDGRRAGEHHDDGRRVRVAPTLKTSHRVSNSEGLECLSVRRNHDHRVVRTTRLSEAESFRS